MAGGATEEERLTFIDREKDSESQLGNFGVRKYDYELGRFISTDVLWENDRSFNPYHYSHNNPINLKDETGLDDGNSFMNRPPKGSSQPLLPVKPKGYYNEYVHPTPGVKGPGLQRIVTGRNGEIYYTPNHYETFIKIGG